MSGDLQVTVPQTYDFTAAAVDRVATLTSLVADVDPVERPNSLRVTMGASVTEVLDPWGSREGDQWDHHTVDITIPAGVSQMTLEAVSRVDGSLQPASLTWIGGHLDVPPPPVPEPGIIGDLVYCDDDDDGVRDPGEEGIGGVDVILVCAGPDLTLGTADDIVRVATTDADGLYLFTDVPPGSCSVSVDASTGPIDKVLGRCPASVDVDLAPGQSYLDADFCFKFPPPGTIGDLVFCDLDDDGVFDPGEPGVEGVTVTLTCAGPDQQLGTADDLIATRTTDAGGIYLFDDVAPGDCRAVLDESSIGCSSRTPLSR